MPQLIVTTREGEERTLEFPLGMTVMEVIRDAGIHELMALCGGSCSCATCHVYVDKQFSGALPPMSTDENDLLDGSNHRKGVIEALMPDQASAQPGWITCNNRAGRLSRRRTLKGPAA
jgi:2Fe-2S ferredoxin